MLVERKRISLEMELNDWLKQWTEVSGIVEAHFSFEVALLSNRLPGKIHGDPADRMLVATAYQENAVLVTADEKLLEAVLKPGLVDFLDDFGRFLFHFWGVIYAG